MEQGLVSVVFLAAIAAAVYFGANAKEKLEDKLKARREICSYSLERLRKMAKGHELTSPVKRLVAAELLAERYGKKKPPGRLIIWLGTFMAD